MRIVNLKIKNFRGIRKTNIFFNSHSVLVGDNNIGKSTVFEAINLVLGPDRSSSANPINEHDFYGSKYLNKDDEAILIYIEVVIVGLSEQQKRHFRAHLEFWNKQTTQLVEEGPVDAVDSPAIDDCLRVCFEGKYNHLEDDFEGDTYFCFPVSDDSEKLKFWKSDKRRCGFLYLRALRTGSRALSLERGSLLDVILRVKELRPKIWEEVIDQLSKVKVADDPELGLSGILEDVQNSIQEYVPQEWGDDPQLRVSNLTRDHLRKTLTVFMATGAFNGGDTHYAPYYYQGTGTINMLLLALLSMIANEKQTVIFAMEEPETAIPPYAQKAIVRSVIDKSSQAFFTTHSPYVLEEFEPNSIVVLQRTRKGKLLGLPFNFPDSIKPKHYSIEFRKGFAEALLSRRVLVVEGKTEYIAYISAAKRLTELDNALYSSLEALGITVFNAETDNKVQPATDLFKRLGKTVYAVFDKQSDQTISKRIEATADISFESPAKGFEDLVINETAQSALRRFALKVVQDGLWPSHLQNIIPSENSSYGELKKAMREFFKRTKGRGDISGLLYECNLNEMPATIKKTLSTIKSQVAPNEDYGAIAM